MGHGSDEDLQQVALLSLVKAVDRFDPTRGHCFSTFATPTILGEIKRYLRDNSRLVRPPRSLHDLHVNVVTKQREMTMESGTVPTLAEVAAALGAELDRVVEAMALEDVCVPCSLTGWPLTESDQNLALEDCLGTEDPEMARVEARVAWGDVLKELDPDLKQVIMLRYYQDITQRDAAARLGVSQMQISRLERRALDRLRKQVSRLGDAIEALTEYR
jgi:RNA polymerase sigma-B factor